LEVLVPPETIQAMVTRSAAFGIWDEAIFT
jgi:hypothetical protein